MKIVADENIPLIKDFFGAHGELVLKPGRAITAEDVLDADILLTRSITKVNQELLKDSKIKFVGSTTTGSDHLDIDWLNSQKIKWSVAQGCNAIAVVEYVISVVAALQKMNFLTQANPRAGVVGVGAIGQRVADVLKLLGFEVVLCDPYRTDLATVSFADLSGLDLISFHTPLTKSGDYPTYHMVQKGFLQKQKKNCVLLNAGRGESFAFDQIKTSGQELMWCFDVWENEPDIDFAILDEALIATPHIAGYSLQSKYRGIEMIYRAAIKFGIIAEKNAALLKYPHKNHDVSTATSWRDVVLSVFDPRIETDSMKKSLVEDGLCFDVLRRIFLDRYEFGFVALQNLHVSQADVSLLQKLGFVI